MAKPALIVIDIQKGFDLPAFWDGPRNNPNMETNALRLIDGWRQADAPVVMVQHMSRSSTSPFYPNTEGNAFKEGFSPQSTEKHVQKHENSAFVGTDLEVWLRREGIRDLAICGATTQHCVSTTTRMAENLGFNVSLVGEACFAMHHGAYDSQTIHDVELNILNGEFATIVTVDEAVSAVNSKGPNNG